jgi:pimeloyl-ACP methyl ester carboxylesterase
MPRARRHPQRRDAPDPAGVATRLGDGTMNDPVEAQVQCLSPAGLHWMRYRQWGDARNPRVVVCVHGLTRTGRDFDRLARALSTHYRVVCPDVVGRGRSDWLRDPAHYRIPQYVADMVTLIARLDVEQVAWVGTSMGGLIGIGLAGMPQSPVSRLVLNDVGPRIEPAALARIGAYVGQPIRFASVEEATRYNRSIAAGFAMRSDEEWREITASVLKPDGDGFVLHYDPDIAQPMRALSAETIAGGEQLLWQLYDAIACPTLLLRGAESDLLSAETAAEMGARGPRPKVVRFDGVGHAPMFYDPAQIETVRQFLLPA